MHISRLMDFFQEFRGVVSLDRDLELETDPSNLDEKAVQVLAACHALVFVDNKLVRSLKS